MVRNGFAEREGSKQTDTAVADAEATLAARRTAATPPLNVRFTSESGHRLGCQDVR
jgi:hypothetical protein